MITINYKDTRPIYEQLVERIEDLAAAGYFEPGAQLRQARRGNVFKLDHRLVPLPERLDPGQRLFPGAAAGVHEGVLQRRADEFDERGLRRDGLAQLFKGVAQAVQDALLGVRQSSVQIEKDIMIHTLPHIPFPKAVVPRGGAPGGVRSRTV